MNLAATEYQYFPDQHKHIERLKKISLVGSAEEFGTYYLAQISLDITDQDLADLISFILKYAGDATQNKEIQDIIDYLIIAASSYAYDRQPEIRNAMQASLVYAVLKQMNPQ